MISTGCTVSIVIDNYNYDSYLAEAIESALNQGYAPIEVIVVDDGSTDASLKVAQQYGDRIKLVAKSNGGQASAFNAGFAASTGDWLLFLDSDDWLESGAISAVAERFRDRPAKIHFQLREYKQESREYGELVPAMPLTEGDAVAEIVANGNYIWPPTSGNVFPRWFLDKCLPMPEEMFPICADMYICLHAAFAGKIASVARPLGAYRIHKNSGYSTFKMEPSRLELRGYNMLMTEKILMQLLARRNLRCNSTLSKECPVIETILLGVRFGGLNLEPFGLTAKELKTRWWASKRAGRHGVTVPVWLVLCWAPAFCVAWVMKLRAVKSRLQFGRMAKPVLDLLFRKIPKEKG